MRVLVTGARGQLGRAMVRAFAAHAVMGVGREELDVTDAATVQAAVDGQRPDCVVNCAAYTDVDGAARETIAATRVNGEGVRNLALACRNVGATLVQISTDYVFDGQTDRPYTIHDDPRPLSVYGESNLEGERSAMALLSRVHIIRTSWLYGVGGRNFVETMLRLGPRGGRVRVVVDQRGAPTLTDDLAKATVDLVVTGRHGLYHVTNQGETTRYEFAQRIFREAGITMEVEPVTSEQLGLTARRPKNCVLDAFPLKETIGYLLPHWTDALTRYLARRRVMIS